MRSFLEGGIFMKEKFVYAVYDRLEEANQAVINLTNAGIPLSAITLFADDDVIEEADQSDVLVEFKELDDDNEGRSIWKQITDFFTGSNKDDEDFPVDFSGYKDEIDDDKILVVVDKTYEGEALSVDSGVHTLVQDDLNEVETYTQVDYEESPEVVVEEDVVEEFSEDVPIEDEEFVAGDMGAETAVTEEYVEHPVPTEPEAEIQVTEDVYKEAGESVAGDNARETEDAENYYTNIDSHRAVEKERESRVAYVKDEASDTELRGKREASSVAGDMGDYSDYAEYYHGAKARKDEAAKVINQADTSEGEPSHELGAFEEEMRRHESAPPADEVGVNPEQFENTEE